MDCITDILTEKIFAFTEGDIMCQFSSQRADRQASTPAPFQQSLVWLYYTFHSAWAQAPGQSPPRAPLQILLVQMEWVRQGGVGRTASKNRSVVAAWPRKSSSTTGSSWTVHKDALAGLWRVWGGGEQGLHRMPSRALPLHLGTTSVLSHGEKGDC